MRAFQQLRVGKRTTIYQPADWRRIMRKFAGCQESVLGLSWWHLVACNVFGINTRSFYPRNIDGWVLRTVKRALTIHVRTGVRLSRIVLQPSLTSRLYKTQHTDRQTIINAYICNIDGRQHKGAMSTSWQTEILIPGDRPSIFTSLDKMWNFNSLQKLRIMTLLKQFIKLESLHKGIMSIHLEHEGWVRPLP